MATQYDASAPVAVIEIGKMCQVSVTSSTAGTHLLFDTPNGEVKVRISDDEWKRLQDAVWLARESRGIFDRSNDNDD